MIKIEKYTGEKTYMYPSDQLADPETVYKQSPAARVFVHIVETDEAGEVMFALQNLSAMRSFYNIDPAMGEDEAIAEIERLRNLPLEEPVASAEERIAAALEFQNILSM